MNEQVTLFITSCGREALLRKTIESFLKFNTYKNITNVVICEDSGVYGCMEHIRVLFVDVSCNIIYNSKRIGQMRSIENGVKYINTPYVFHCEDDWEFYEYGFIEESFNILNSDPKISQVLLRDYSEYLYRYKMSIINIDNSLCKRIKTREGIDIYSFNPSLKRTEIQMLNIPYNDWDDEYTIQTKINTLGYYAVVANKPSGYVNHIGWNDHINESDDIKYRKDFIGK
jgi:hypothetical protein